MAIYNLYVSYESEGDGRIDVGNPSWLNNLERGDYVRFHEGYGGNGSIKVYGFGSNWEGSFSYLSIPYTGYAQARVTSTATSGYTADFAFTKSGATTVQRQYRIIVPDTTPDRFSLPNSINQNPKTDLLIGVISVLGINTDTPISFSTISGTRINTRVLVKRGSYVKSTSSAENGDSVYVYAEAPTGYNESYTARITIGGTYTNFVVSTLTYPYIDQEIPFGHATGAISLKADVAAFFGGEGSASLSEYYKYPGGLHVPSMGQNSSIPTSGTISLSDFRNAYTAFYFIKSPLSKFDSADTTSAAQNLSLVWNKVSDWEIGWGDDLELTSSYMYDFIRDDNETGTVSFGVASGQTEGGFSTGNTYAVISASSDRYTEKMYHGRLRIYARNSVSNSTYTIMREISWRLSFYGP